MEEQTLYDRLGGREGIAKLLKHFYADVRQHEVLGPIFNSQIKDWPAHLAHIGEFWARQTGGPSRYHGGFAAAHLRVGEIRSEHLAHWLGLWELNCGRNLGPREAGEMIGAAHRIGGQLLRILGGRSGLELGGGRAVEG